VSRTRWHLVANAVVLAWLTAAAVVGFAHGAVPDSRWLVVHLLALGGVTTAILVWSSHFTVTLLHLSPPSRRAEGSRLVLLTAGVVAVVAGVVAETWPWAAVGSCLVAGAVAAHVVSLTRSLRTALSARFGVTVRF
jgi:nitrite reductase (NO-forming)